MDLYYQLNDRPPLAKCLILGLQHLLAALPGIIGAPLVIASVLGFSIQETVILVNASLLMSGIGSIIQASGLGPYPLGARLPVIQGTSYAFVGVAISIGFQYGYAAVIGATIAGGLVEILLSFIMPQIRKLFPPVVTGTVVCLIGMTIFPVAVDWLGGGGQGAEDYGSLINLGVGMAVMLTVVYLNQWFKGFISAAAIIIGTDGGLYPLVPPGKAGAVQFHGSLTHRHPQPTAFWRGVPPWCHHRHEHCLYGFHG